MLQAIGFKSKDTALVNPWDPSNAATPGELLCFLFPIHQGKQHSSQDTGSSDIARLNMNIDSYKVIYTPR